MTGPTQHFEPEQEPLNVTHEMFAQAAISKLMLPTDETNVQYSIANSLLAIYGVLGEMSHSLAEIAISLDTQIALTEGSR